MNLLLIDNSPDDLELFLRCCRHRGHVYEVVRSADISIDRAQQYDAVILTGGIWYDDPTLQQTHYSRELELIESGSVPVLGICLGMQIIAAAFDGELMKLKNEYHGERTITVTDEGQQTLDLPPELRVIENHTIGVVRAPAVFDVMARSEECIEIIAHRHLPLVGVQFHPEKMNKQEHVDRVWDGLFRRLNKV